MYERACENETFLAAVKDGYLIRGGKVTPEGDIFDEYGDPCSLETWEEAYDCEFRSLISRVFQLYMERFK